MVALNRETVRLSRPSTIVEAIAGDAALRPFLEGKTEKKFLYVPGRIINVVVA